MFLNFFLIFRIILEAWRLDLVFICPKKGLGIFRKFSKTKTRERRGRGERETLFLQFPMPI